MMSAPKSLYQRHPRGCIGLKALDFGKVNLLGHVTGYHDAFNLNTVLEFVASDLDP